MKVVMAIHHFPPRYVGGAEWETYRLASALQARGHAVQVVCVEHVDRGPATGVAWEDAQYAGVPVRRLSFRQAAAPDPFHWEYDNRWIGDHLRDLLAEQRPDVFHLVSGYLITGRALLAAAELAVPSVVTLEDFWFLCRRIAMLRSDGRLSTLPISAAGCARCMAMENRREHWPGRWAEALSHAVWQLQPADAQRFEARAAFLRHALAQAEVVISRSHFVAARYEAAGFAHRPILQSRQGMDFPRLTPAVLVKTPAPVLRVGYLGQITSHKGVHVLFDAVRRLPGAPLTVRAYGDPATFPAYTARLRRLAAVDRRLELPGLVQPGQLTRLFQGLDVIVVPSEWYENSPNVILEAFAHGTPVVASNLGGMAELVQDGVNGLLFPAGDAEALAQRLQRLLLEPRLLAELRHGIGPVRTLAQEVDELEGIYEQVARQDFAYAHRH